MRLPLPRTLIVTGLIAVLAAGCGTQARESEDSKTTIQLNWHPEAEHGGVYQALADGTYESAGLDVAIRPGGLAVTIAPELELGRCGFAITNADDVVVFRREGAKIVAVLAAVQNHPRCILVRADSGVESFQELAGMTLQRQPGRLFLEYMRDRGLLEGVREVAYNGVAGLATDPKMAIQAYSFAEPRQAQQQGIETRTLMVSELGWNPYSSVLVTTETLIRDEPERVRRVVQATRRGWQNYLADPTAGNKAILEANEYGMTPEALAYGSEQLRTLAMPGDMSPESVGMMTHRRWETLVRQIDELAPETAGTVQPEECYTTRFLE